jgi:hypothetical protein
VRIAGWSVQRAARPAGYRIESRPCRALDRERSPQGSQASATPGCRSELECCEGWPTKQQDHAKTGEIEEEDQKHGGHEGRPQQRDEDAKPNEHGSSDEGGGGLAQSRIEARQGSPHKPDHNGSVVEDMGSQDSTECAREGDRRAGEVEDSDQHEIEPAARPEECAEACSHHDCRQHEGHRRECPQQGLSGKGVVREKDAGIPRRASVWLTESPDEGGQAWQAQGAD